MENINFSLFVMILSQDNAKKASKLGGLAKNLIDGAVWIGSSINDVVRGSVKPLVDSLAEDEDVGTYPMRAVRKRKLKTHRRNTNTKLTQSHPKLRRRVKRRKMVQKGNDDGDRLKNHKMDFFSDTMEKYMRHREVLAEGAMKVGEVDRFVNGLAEKRKTIGRESNQTVNDVVAMPKVDILKID